MVNGRDPVMEGQNANSQSLPVVLSTEQGIVLQNIDNSTAGTLVEVTASAATLDSVTKTNLVTYGSGDAGLATLGVRQDSISAISTNNRYIPISTDSKGRVWATGGAVDDAAFTPGTDTVGVAGFLVDETSTDTADEGDAGAARMTPDRKVIVTIQPHTSGGLTQHKLISAASTNATSLKASAGQVYGIQVFNLNAAARYLKLYNKASAPTVGTDTPVKVFMIPGNAAGAGIVSNWINGVEFNTGIAYALTTGIADSDTGAVAASEIVVNVDYK